MRSLEFVKARVVSAFLILVLFTAASFGQAANTDEPVVPAKWFEKIHLRGYAQFRFNRLGNPDAAVISPQGDKAIGNGNSFSIRRARLVFSGDVSDRVSLYLQPDFASAPDTNSTNPSGNFAQLRDLYGDVYLDASKEYRLRIGQSKVPYGFENMQSSQNRLALDRNDALNSAVKDEREIGVFFYWAPTEVRKRFKYLTDSGLKGSGDYGVFGFGGYNGQNANRTDQNRDLHFVARLTYPFEFEKGQIVETSVQAYTGRFVVGTDPAIAKNNDYLDQRWAASLIYYPQPFGFQAEYNSGIGPQLNSAQTAVEDANLEGGYVQVMYRFDKLMPFARAQYYRGGRKHDANAPAQDIRETEVGLEWEADKALELTATYSWTDRNTSTPTYPVRSTNLIRVQAQINY